MPPLGYIYLRYVRCLNKRTFQSEREVTGDNVTHGYVHGFASDPTLGSDLRLGRYGCITS